MFSGRSTQLDLRVSKLLELGPRMPLDAHVDAYNVLNASSIITLVGTYGPLWTQPSGLNAILEGRLIQFGDRCILVERVNVRPMMWSRRFGEHSNHDAEESRYLGHGSDYHAHLDLPRCWSRTPSG